MDRVLSFLNNRWLVAVVVGLFLMGLARRFAGR